MIEPGQLYYSSLWGEGVVILISNTTTCPDSFCVRFYNLTDMSRSIERLIFKSYFEKACTLITDEEEIFKLKLIIDGIN
jgi:hypothetical protein